MRQGLHVRCDNCNQTNRVPVSKLSAGGKCGRCKAPLSPPREPIEVERADELGAIITNADLPVVVDFWASWCGPCRMVAPEVAKIARERAGQWLVVKANTEVDPQLGAAHGIRSIPTMAVFSRGKEVGRTHGAQPSARIAEFVEHSLRGG